jgi:hypothetical protein
VAAALAVATFSRFRPRYYDGELTLKFMTKEISRWHLLSLVAGAQKLERRLKTLTQGDSFETVQSVLHMYNMQYTHNFTDAQRYA